MQVGDIVGYVDLTKPEPLDNEGPSLWHVVVTDPARERSTVERINDIEDRRLDPYLPIVHRTELAGRGRKRDVQAAMFPCYFFIRMPANADRWRQLRGIRGVQDFMAFASGRPKVMASAAIEAIRIKEMELDNKRLMRLASGGEIPWKPGQSVWVDILPYHRMLANIGTAHDKGKIEVLLEMEMFGRKAWKVEPKQILNIDV
ncbi:transcription antitermination factor NusG [Afipia massiliensis]|uniref:Transcription antitermination factor NusG n=1 Tax=Afipia massiliensis TaxID=211460 RepID=A0A840MZJ6_9BRAD|nr:transcription termination/antitermination NusG family protein [Afipia massiliensis]MBB5051138.1 transcription antitermination factor NusG [Afipia massiliensis]